jgi:hypothetical protein
MRLSLKIAAAGRLRPPRKGDSRNRGFLIRGGIPLGIFLKLVEAVDCPV